MYIFDDKSLAPFCKRHNKYILDSFCDVDKVKHTSMVYLQISHLLEWQLSQQIVKFLFKGINNSKLPFQSVNETTLFVRRKGRFHFRPGSRKYLSFHLYVSSTDWHDCSSMFKQPNLIFLPSNILLKKWVWAIHNCEYYIFCLHNSLHLNSLSLT